MNILTNFNIFLIYFPVFLAYDSPFIDKCGSNGNTILYFSAFVLSSALSPCLIRKSINILIISNYNSYEYFDNIKYISMYDNFIKYLINIIL